MNAQMRAASIVFVLCPASFAALAEGNACALVTPGELESVVGAKPVLSPSEIRGVSVCSGGGGGGSVVIRLVKRTGDPSGKTETAGVEAVKKMGATVETRTFGPIFCMAITPNAQLAPFGFTTTCTVSKHPMYAVIEVKTQKQLTPIDKVHPIAEKMSSRF